MSITGISGIGAVTGVQPAAPAVPAGARTAAVSQADDPAAFFDMTDWQAGGPATVTLGTASAGQAPLEDLSRGVLAAITV